MTEKEKLQALQVLDSFLSDENDSQLPTDDTQTSGNAIS